MYTDVVFYSSNFSAMKKELLDKGIQLDGVFFADREDLTTVVDSIIKKNLRREFNLVNIRGLLMDNTSNFDYVCRTAANEVFTRLSPENQNMIEDELKERIAKTSEICTKNFEKLSKKTGAKYVQTALNSVDYVMQNKDRYYIFCRILELYGITSFPADKFPVQYQQEIIKPRNDLAHNKLLLGNCRKKLFIAKNRNSASCDKNCDNCTAKYSIADCGALRQKLFDYYQQFIELDESLVVSN